MLPIHTCIRMNESLRADNAPGPSQRAPARPGPARPGPSHRQWLSVCILIALALGPPVVALWGHYALAHRDAPQDRDLAANFAAHETDFDGLIHMLEADRQLLLHARASEIDRAMLQRLLAKERADRYFATLMRISV